MKIKRYTPIYKDGKWVDSTMHYGRGDANTLTYLLDGFREGWSLIGLIQTEEEYLGVKIDGYSLISVYGKRHEPELQSDDSTEREQSQVDDGKTAIVLFYGTDNSSYMRRMTPEEYDTLELITFRYEKDDLFYNS